MPQPDRLLVARIGAPHGVRGEVRLQAFGDDPEALLGYGDLAAADGRTVRVTGLKTVGGRLIARLAGIGDRNAAERLTGLDLHIDRAKLPPPEDDDTFYHADLVGLAAVTVDGAPLGTVVAVPNYGAGDLLEIAPPRGASLLVPFTKAVVPTIDLAAGRLVVDPPAGLLEAGRPEADEDGAPPDATAPSAGRRWDGGP
jgi:16S rRNA processing protein RimM